MCIRDRSGVLARVSNLFCRRGFNIDSLTVSATNDPSISRITVTLRGSEQALSQLILQTERLEVTRQVFELDPEKSLQRELLLLKVACDNHSRAELREISSIYKAKIIDLSPVSYTHLDVYKRQVQQCGYHHRHPEIQRCRLRLPERDRRLPGQRAGSHCRCKGCLLYTSRCV